MQLTARQFNKYKFENVSVLYVEDEANSREKLLRVLKRRFANIHVAIDGEDGYELYSKVLPDLIITDIKMSQMSGLRMIEKIRRSNDKVQIIVTTDHDDNDFFIRSIENNVNHFILKPLDLERLLQVIQKSVYEIQLEKELEKQKQLTRSILDFQENLIFVIENNRIVEYNDAFSSFTGINKEHSFPKTNILAPLFLENPNYFFPINKENCIEEMIERGNSAIKVHWKGKNGKEVIFIIKSTAINNQSQLLFVCTDITDLETESRKNELLAMMDPLTNSFNRLKFDELLTAEIRRTERYQHPFSIIMFDIDYFKKVNDNLGHQKGDEVLTILATMVQQRIRECDILARWGGEEFILLAPETNEKRAVLLAESIRQLIQDFHFEGVGQITCSFGVSEFGSEKSKTELLNEADQALSQSKSNGRNCVTVFAKEPLKQEGE